MRTSRYVPIVAATIALLGGAGVASAQTARRSDGGGNNAALLGQLQQLASERTALQAENAKLKGELDKLRKERDVAASAREVAETRVRAVAATVGRGSADAERLQAELDRERGRMQELVSRSREIATSLRDVEIDRNQARQVLATRESELKACTERNGKLYALNGEVLDAMERRGVWSSVTAAEPFTRIKRNQLENLTDGFRQKALDQRVEPGTTQAAAPASAAPAPAAR